MIGTYIWISDDGPLIQLSIVVHFLAILIVSPVAGLSSVLSGINPIAEKVREIDGPNDGKGFF